MALPEYGKELPNFSHHLAEIKAGKAITAEQVKNMSDKELAKNLTDTLRRMQTKSRIKQGKEPYDY